MKMPFYPTPRSLFFKGQTLSSTGCHPMMNSRQLNPSLSLTGNSQGASAAAVDQQQHQQLLSPPLPPSASLTDNLLVDEVDASAIMEVLFRQVPPNIAEAVGASSEQISIDEEEKYQDLIEAEKKSRRSTMS